MATGKLAEVEEAAMRIQTKRFNDHFEEQAFQKEKRAKEEVKQANKIGKEAK